jgi:hypothetical protein
VSCVLSNYCISSLLGTVGRGEVEMAEDVKGPERWKAGGRICAQPTLQKWMHHHQQRTEEESRRDGHSVSSFRSFIIIVKGSVL